MKSKKLTSPKTKSKKSLKLSPESTETAVNNKLGLFDHVKHIRTQQLPNYYNNLSEENRKTFNHFMILRALAMDNDIIQEMSFLYRFHHLIPSPQFYTLLISLVPKGNRWVPWIKTKVIKHNPDVVMSVSTHYKISKRQANEYINVLLSSEDGRTNLNDLCRAIGIDSGEIEKLLNEEDV